MDFSSPVISIALSILFFISEVLSLVPKERIPANSICQIVVIIIQKLAEMAKQKKTEENTTLVGNVNTTD
jgi:Na+/glutamate symporter